MDFLIFWIGLYSLLAQTILLRELAFLFPGNELALASTFAAWLFWTAVGASHPPDPKTRTRFPLHLGLLALTVPATDLLIRLSRLFLPPGRPAGLFFTVTLPFVTLAAAGWLFGKTFSANVVLAEKNGGRNAPGRTYFLEGLGALAGGGLSLLFFDLGNSSLGVLSVSGATLAALNFFLFRRAAPKTTSLFLCLGLLFAAGARPLDNGTRRAQWRRYPLVATRETPYAHAAVARWKADLLFFENGSISAQWPDPERYERLAHWPLLCHPNPRRILVLGLPGALAAGEILKHPVDALDIVLTDKRAWDLFRGPLDGDDPGPRRDERIRFHFTDPRTWIKEHPRTYDVILQSLPEPQNISGNRLFTEEFFSAARQGLEENGLLSFSLASSDNYLSPETLFANASILRAVEKSFPFQELLPGAALTVLAANREILLDPQALAARHHQRRLETTALHPKTFEWTLQPERRNLLRLRLDDLRHVVPNSDLFPVAIFLTWRVWLTKFVSSPDLLGVVAAMVLLALLLKKAARHWKDPATLPENSTLFAVGFAAMSLEIVLLYVFQAASGALYWQIGILTAAFMGGLSAGSFCGFRRSGPPPNGAALGRATVLMAGLCALTAVELDRLPSFTAPLPAAMALLSAGGFLVGWTFSRASSGRTEKAGGFYSADLWGAALGVFLTGTFLSPLLGHAGALFVSTGLLFLSLVVSKVFSALRKRRS
ncbi:MAG TPA: hypothetical protein P5079_06005 [Elusimicrobiota bacterium]|nr:hypothetical protein [Elusimicrobiota bacterium]